LCARKFITAFDLSGKNKNLTSGPSKDLSSTCRDGQGHSGAIEIQSELLLEL